MTQKSMAQQIAEAQNIVTALSKKLEEQLAAPKPLPERKLTKFLCTYDDGTSQWFVPEVVERKWTTEEVYAQIRPEAKAKYAAKVALAVEADVASHPRKGTECVILGKRYNSISHAARSSGMCRTGISVRLSNGKQGYDYV